MTIDEMYKEAEVIERELGDLAYQQRVLLNDHEDLCKRIVKEEKKVAEENQRKN